MSKMKDLFIQMQNEDWERMPLHERAIIEAERRLDEEQLWLEIMQEEELKQAKILKDDKHQEIQSDTATGARLEHDGIDAVHRPENGHVADNATQQGAQLAFDFGEDRKDS